MGIYAYLHYIQPMRARSALKRKWFGSKRQACERVKLTISWPFPHIDHPVSVCSHLRTSTLSWIHIQESTNQLSQFNKVPHIPKASRNSVSVLKVLRVIFGWIYAFIRWKLKILSINNVPISEHFVFITNNRHQRFFFKLLVSSFTKKKHGVDIQRVLGDWSRS